MECYIDCMHYCFIFYNFSCLGNIFVRYCPLLLLFRWRKCMSKCMPNENCLWMHENYCIISLNIHCFGNFHVQGFWLLCTSWHPVCAWSGSTRRTNVWPLMVWSWWPMWVGNISSWCWIYIWTGYSCSVQPYQWAHTDFKSPPACYGRVQLVSGVWTLELEFFFENEERERGEGGALKTFFYCIFANFCFIFGF